MTGTTSIHRGLLLLLASGLPACDGRSPSGPTSLPPTTPTTLTGPTVTAISPSLCAPTIGSAGSDN